MKYPALIGQSLLAEMTTLDDGTIPAPPDCYMLDLSHGTPATIYGNGGKRLTSTLRALTGDSVTLINGAWGNSALLAGNADPSYPWLHWSNYAAPSPLLNFWGMCDGAGIVPDCLVWGQGQRDYFNSGGYPDVNTAYYNAVGTMYAATLAHFNRTAAQMPLIISPSAAYSGVKGVSQHVIAAQMRFAIDGHDPNVSLGTSQWGIPTRDGTHYTLPGYELYGCQLAGSISSRYGTAGSMQGAGPRIISGTRTGSTIMLDLQLYGSHLQYNTNLTGFQLWAQDWSFQPTCYADCYNDQVRLQMSWVGGTWVTYEMNALQDGSNPFRSVYDPSACGKGYVGPPLPYAILC